MNSLILIAHGSRVEDSNNEVVSLIKRLKDKNKDENLCISYAFLELAEPSIEHSIKEQIKKGCKKIILLPYFLAQGKHVKVDIPNEINKYKDLHKNIEFVLLPHLGANDMIIDLILSNAKGKI
ncbi:hypothetical protein CRU98_09855 [Arcobacter sp. CECT 8986]|uniref:sirohydrochlorin chelatase n=1 Tax=Arcobacter sp. CECT 8986 TaxID=2044507 RepID=UPI001009B73C|nr:CbiX/SirB N-terminal domain-containing protein [Arcobacter sp. CECT 8986]RXJ98335.1 hypothetical protein CRU98_09855 [Arcobacter sp. CECT 8986]